MSFGRMSMLLYQSASGSLVLKFGKCQPSKRFFQNIPHFKCIPKSISPRLCMQSSRPSVIIQNCHSIVSASFSRPKTHHAQMLCSPWIHHKAGVTNVMRQEYRGLASKDSARNRVNIDPMARYGNLQPSSLKLGYEKSKELEDANEQVKKIFSLEFADDHEIQVYRRSKLVKDIQKDPTDTSLPVKIAVLTVHLRAAAKQLNRSKKDLLAKDKLLGMIGKRRRLLKELRNTDYERFERLLVELGITYTLPPPKNAVRVHTRRYLEKLVVRKKAAEQRQNALEEYLAEKKKVEMEEIIALKKELGRDLTEEEMTYLESSKTTS